MAYPVIQTPPVPDPMVTGTCTDCIVSLPVQSTTSMRFSTVVTEGQNLVLKNVGTINAIYPSDNVAEQSITIPPGEFFAVNQPLSALCIHVSTTALVNLILAGGNVISLNVSQMLFIDEQLQGFEITAATGTDAPDVRADVFYAVTAQ